MVHQDGARRAGNHVRLEAEGRPWGRGRGEVLHHPEPENRESEGRDLGSQAGGVRRPPFSDKQGPDRAPNRPVIFLGEKFGGGRENRGCCKLFNVSGDFAKGGG